MSASSTEDVTVELADALWALAKQYNRDDRKTPLTYAEQSLLKRASSHLHALARPHRGASHV